MKSKLNRMFAAVMVIGCLMVCAAAAIAGETKYATGTASAAVTFGPSAGRLTVRSVYSVTDKVGGVSKVYGWDRTPAPSPTTAPAATNIIYITNTAALTNANALVYVHADGTLDYRTVSSATSSNVTLNANISKAGTTSDRLFRLSQIAQLAFSTAGAGVGTNKYGVFEGVVAVAHGPLYAVQDGTSNAVINVTVED